jgi:hypothetical protein
VVKHFGLVREYKAHLKSVRLDRDLEQHFEGLSPQAERPTLFVQLDGLDQSKWSIPRYPGNKASKDLQKYIRPRLKIVGCWCSRYLLSLYVVDVNFAHDASCTVEAWGSLVFNIISGLQTF